MPDRKQLALQVRIGGFILAGLLVFLAIIYLLGAQARYFERKHQLVAEFTQVGGLIEGATVRLAGVQIGRVTSVDLPPEPGGKVRVTMTIGKRFTDRIRRDSEARIATQGLLGDKLIEITIGSPDAPPLAPGELLASEDPFEMSEVFAAGARTLTGVNRLTSALTSTVEQIDKAGTIDKLNRLTSAAAAAMERIDEAGTVDKLNRLTAALGGAVDRLNRSGTLDELGSAVKSARRITDQIEKGNGWAHALLYEEPQALRRLDEILVSTQALIARAQSPDSAVSAVLSPESGRAVRSLLAAMDALGHGAERAGAGEGLLTTLLFDPQYQPVARDLQVVARNFRDVSEKLANGQGLLGSLLQDQGDGGLGTATADFKVALANLRAVSERLKSGDGTLGALLDDPTVYEKLVQFLEGSRRSFLLRSLIRSTIGGGGAPGR
jgi:phospholipid/cholesterol/gamma-HCH transport system substrate-binding protein